MEKKFSKFTIAAMKRTAENVNQYTGKRDRLIAKMHEMQVELESLNAAIAAADAPTKAITGGFGSEDLFEKVVTDTGKVNKDGNPIKVTKFVLKYPETVIPVIDIEMATMVAESPEYNAVEELPVNNIDFNN